MMIHTKKYTPKGPTFIFEIFPSLAFLIVSLSFFFSLINLTSDRTILPAAASFLLNGGTLDQKAGSLYQKIATFLVKTGMLL